MADLVETPLFDLPEGAQRVPEPEQPLTRGERRQRLIATRVATGTHPLAGVAYGLRLHPDAPRQRGDDGPTCGTCRFRRPSGHHNRTYPKCWFGDGVRASHSEASDVRAWWPACTDWAVTR